MFCQSLWQRFLRQSSHHLIRRTGASCTHTVDFTIVANLARKSEKAIPLRSLSQGYSFFSTVPPSAITPLEFESVCSETLDSLADYLEEVVESTPVLKNGDVTYSDGVITAFLGADFGTYVINRQTPNQQIWLSSPTSGPKRYDFVNKVWLYKHDNTTLHSLLDKEISSIIKQPVHFSHCAFGGKN